MITLTDWESHCVTRNPLYFMHNGEVETVPYSIAIAYDDVIKNFVLCFSTWNVSFRDIYTTRLQCAESYAKELVRRESNE